MIRINEIKNPVSTSLLTLKKKTKVDSTQNEGKTSPALVTTQISIAAPFFLHFETNFKSKFPSETELWEPLNEDNDSDIIVTLQN